MWPISKTFSAVKDILHEFELVIDAGAGRNVFIIRKRLRSAFQTPMCLVENGLHNINIQLFNLAMVIVLEVLIDDSAHT